MFSRLLNIFVLIFFLSTSLSAISQVPLIEEIEQHGLIRVNIPKELENKLTYHEPANATQPNRADDEVQTSKAVKVGYRIQVFDDNNPQTAKAGASERKALIENKFPEFQGYVTFNSPYWRVKVGDFRTRSEAEAAMGALRVAFPTLASQFRVVRDKINPR